MSKGSRASSSCLNFNNLPTETLGKKYFDKNTTEAIYHWKPSSATSLSPSFLKIAKLFEDDPKKTISEYDLKEKNIKQKTIDSFLNWNILDITWEGITLTELGLATLNDYKKFKSNE